MDILKSRRTAAGVLAAVIILLTPLGSALSLGRAVDKVEARFSEGVGTSGSIESYLEDALRGALGLITIGGNYGDLSRETGELRAAREAMMSFEGSISETGVMNRELQRAFGALKSGLMSQNLTSDDSSNLDYYANIFEGAEGAISHSGYNEAVEEFTRDVYDRFPASLTGRLLGVDPPEYFD